MLNFKKKKMKINKYLCLILGISALTGCGDIDNNLEGQVLAETFFTSEESVQTAVNGVFGNMHNRFFLSRETGLTLMLRSDMVEISDPNTRSERIDHNNLNDLADNRNNEETWPQMYKIVSSANVAITGAQDLEETNSLNRLIAQARFGRAFAYFHLVRQYGAIPMPPEAVTDVVSASAISRTPVAEVYESIIEDLEFAKLWLSDIEVNRSIPAKSTASAYLALVHLTMGSFQEAYDESTELIGNESLYQLGLEPDFQRLFDSATALGSNEPLFLLDFIGNGILGDDSTDYLVPLTGIRDDDQFNTPEQDNQEGWAVTVPSLRVYETWDDQDYRKLVSFNSSAIFGIDNPDFDDSLPVSDDNPENLEIVVNYTDGPTDSRIALEQAIAAENGTTFVLEDVPRAFADDLNGGDTRNVNQPYGAKYTRFRGVAEGNGRASSQKYMLMRYAEVLLIAAESAIEIGNEAEALTYINRVRARARAGGNTVILREDIAVPASPEPADLTSVTVADVLEERRLELAFELKRWYDIVRREMGPEVFGESGLEGFKENFNEAEDYLLAIPASEVAKNPALGQ